MAKGMAKKKRFDDFYRYYPNVPIGQGIFSKEEIEELSYAHFLNASKHFEEKFQAGDEQAIFRFVKQNPECFREVWLFPSGKAHPCYSQNNVFIRKTGRSWVIEQIEKWKADDTPEAHRKLKKLFKAYTDGRGQKRKASAEDWRIYNQIRRAYKKSNNLTAAIWKVVDSNNKIETELSKELQRRLLKETSPKMDRRKLKEKLDPIIEETGIKQRKLMAYIKTNKTIFNTYREIYYKLSKLEKEFEKLRSEIEENFRRAYFLAESDITIPAEYEKQFKEELSLYCNVEWLWVGMNNFPLRRSDIQIYTGVRPFEEERLPINEALEKVSKEKNIPLSKLKEIFTTLRKLAARGDGSTHRLEVLKEL